MKVEREARRGVMRDHGLMHVHGAFRSAGRAAGEMQQRDVFRIGRRNREVLIGCRKQRAEIARTGQPLDRGGIGHEEHVFEARQRRAQRLDFPLVEDIGRDKHLRAGDVDSRLNRFRPERIALADPEAREHVGEPVGGLAQLGVRQVPRRA